MNERALFPQMGFFKREVTDRFLIALREVFKKHPVYEYNDDEGVSRIHIDPTYANITYDGRNPRFLVKVGSYQFGLNDMLGQNTFEEVYNNQGVIGGYRSLKIIGTTITVIVRSFAEEESSDLADELATLGVFSAHYMFAQVGINIRDSEISETAEADNNNDLYETVVNLRAEVPWEFVKAVENPADKVEFETDPWEDELLSDYRSPGVYTFRGKIADK